MEADGTVGRPAGIAEADGGVRGVVLGERGEGDVLAGFFLEEAFMLFIVSPQYYYKPHIPLSP